MNDTKLSSVSEFKNLRSDFYNAQIRAIDDFAEITSCTDIMNQYIDQYDTYTTIVNLRRVAGTTESVKHAAEALIASTEVSIFTITGAIIKAIYNIAKFFLRLLGKIIKFVFSFFKHNNNDTRKDLEGISNYINLIQKDRISSGVRASELTTFCNIINEHASCVGLTPETGSSEGMTIDSYKKLYYQKFNDTVKDFARVHPNTSELQNPINPIASATVFNLGWTSYDRLMNGLSDLDSAEKRISDTLKTLKDKSKDIKRLVEECESNGYVANKFIEAKSRDAIDAACFTTVLVKDLRKLKAIEDRFGDMATEMKKHAKKNVSFS